MLEQEQNTLFQALLARAFGHPCASPQSPQQSVLFLKPKPSPLLLIT